MHVSSLDAEVRDGVIQVVAEPDEIVAVCLDGEFDLADVPALDHQLDLALERGRGLIVDLSEATFIDSTIIDVLLRTANAAAAREIPMVLQVGMSTVARTIAIVGADRVIARARHRHEAVQIIRRRHRAGAEARVHRALLERARHAIQAARLTVDHSEQLAWLCGEWSQQPLTARCSWCSRYRVGESWFEARLIPPIPASRTTHTICGDCTEALRRAGKSR